MIKTTKRPRKTIVKEEPVKVGAVKTEAVKTEAPKAAPVKLEPPRLPEAPTYMVPPAPKEAPPKPNRVSLELVKPGAKHVFVAGSFNGWKPDKTPLTPLGNGHWVGDLTVKPGRHEYLFVVDGQWLPDPNAKETVQNPFGGRNSVLIVSA